MKKLRLLVSSSCNRFCSMCCNQTHDVDNLPVVGTYEDYDEIILTGGEPMLKPFVVHSICARIRYVNPKANIYMYTAKSRPPANLIAALAWLDGITLTLHEPKDVQDFWRFQEWYRRSRYARAKDMRLNIFEEAGDMPHYIPYWRQQNMVWQKECPLPDQEVLMRYKPVTKAERNYSKAFEQINLRTV